MEPFQMFARNRGGKTCCGPWSRAPMVDVGWHSSVLAKKPEARACRPWRLTYSLNKPGCTINIAPKRASSIRNVSPVARFHFNRLGAPQRVQERRIVEQFAIEDAARFIREQNQRGPAFTQRQLYRRSGCIADQQALTQWCYRLTAQTLCQALFTLCLGPPLTTSRSNAFSNVFCSLCHRRIAILYRCLSS